MVIDEPDISYDPTDPTAPAYVVPEWPEGVYPSFDPVSGTLTIPAALLTEDTLCVSISISTVEVEEDAVCTCETKCAELNEACEACAADISGCTGTEPEVTEPEVTEPEVTKPDATKPDGTEPDGTEPEQKRNHTHQPTHPFLDEWAELLSGPMEMENEKAHDILSLSTSALC